MEGLVYKGKIIERAPIDGADRIELATAICGSGGKWRGVVPKGCSDSVDVFLPDALLPDIEAFEFMRKHHFRVKQRRFKGAPSECLMIESTSESEIGTDLTEALGVTKYIKPSTGFKSGEALGDFPSFIPKTDEVNAQKVPWMIEQLQGRPYIITLKLDGSSTTVYKQNGVMHVCSRNLELKDTPGSAYWEAARSSGFEARFGDDMVVQCEMCGPGIQKNRLGLDRIRLYIFDVYNMISGKYSKMDWPGMFNGELAKYHGGVRFPESAEVPVVTWGDSFNMTLDDLQKIASEQTYPSGHPAEGIVVRERGTDGCTDPNGFKQRLSFKVINLLYND